MESPSEGAKQPSRRAPSFQLRTCPDDGIVVVMHWLYILRCADGSLYIGEASDLALRVQRHNEGRAASFTALRRPVTLVYSEAHENRDSALRRERQLKQWTRAKKEALVRGDLATLKKL